MSRLSNNNITQWCKKGNEVALCIANSRCRSLLGCQGQHKDQCQA